MNAKRSKHVVNAKQFVIIDMLKIQMDGITVCQSAKICEMT